MVEQTTTQIGEGTFTHRWYRRFIDRVRTAGYEFRMFGADMRDGDVVLRHDVDLSVEAALRMARIEDDIDVQSTYCFLLTSPLYNPLEASTREKIREIDELGHEVTVHVSTHAYWDADDEPPEEDIERQVRTERSVFEAILPPSETVSFHRPPKWVLDREFADFRNTYAPAYFGDIGYLADSSQRWREEPPDVESAPERLQILTHPGLWDEEDGTFTQRVEHAIADSCTDAKRKTVIEYLDGGDDR